MQRKVGTGAKPDFRLEDDSKPVFTPGGCCGGVVIDANQAFSCLEQGDELVHITFSYDGQDKLGEITVGQEPCPQ